jgi:hypothetical protein
MQAVTQFTKEVTIMKTFMTIASMVVLTLAFGLAYADEFPIANRDVGTELYLSAFPTHDSTAAVKDFGIIGKREPEAAEVGTALYNNMIKDSMVAKSEVKGSAAGGVAKDDERTVIWDNLLGAPGGSDLP